MSNSNPWGKFFWNDWETDPALRLCSFSAQGLWMRLLCICAKSDPVGFLTVEGNALSHDDLSILIGRPAAEIVPLLAELSSRGVFSRDAKGRIYSRRMVRDAKSYSLSKKNGKLGGNPSLLNTKENSHGVILDDKGWLKAQKPYPNSINPESETPIIPLSENFEKFWEVFPRQRRGDKQKTQVAWKSALTRTKSTEEEIYEGAVRYAEYDAQNPGFAKGAAAWLNDSRWTDGPVSSPATHGKPAYGDSLARAASRVRDSFGREAEISGDEPF